MPFSDELVPGAFLSWLRAAAPEVVDWLHDGHRRRLFTCSSLHFSSSMQPHLRAEREHIHLPLDPHKTCTVRLTLLLGELFPLFSSALTQFSVSGQGARSLPFIQPGKQLFLLEEVLLTTDDATGWTGFTSIPSCSSLCLAPNPLSVLPCPYHAIRDAPSVSCDTLCPRHPHSRRCCLR